MTNQRGRSMVEMLGTLAIMGVLSVTGIWAYGNAIDSHKANRILNDLNARIHDCSAQMVMMNKDECQLSSFPDKMDDAYATSVQKIDSDFFKVIISDVPQKICQQILNKGIPLASHINLTSCNETNQFELIFHKNLNSSIFRKKCTSDVDCDICGSCDSDGYCLGECLLPSPDSEENCGENECIIYDEESKTCRDACERVEYLESTGTQYIDTGLQTDRDYEINCTVSPNIISNGWYGVFGVYYGTGSKIQAIMIGVYDNKRYTGGADGYTFGDRFYDSFKDYPRIDKISMKSGQVTINGDSISNAVWGTINPSDATLYLGALCSENTVIRNVFKGRIYSFNIVKNGNSIIDFIPVISPDGEPCMFDKVSQKLFCNVGSGTFKTNKD